MNALWRRFRALPRIGRAAVVLLVALPIIRLVEGDWGDTFELMFILVLITILPLLLLDRFYPPVDGVSPHDPAHPAFRQASWVDVGLAVVGGLIALGILELLGY